MAQIYCNCATQKAFEYVWEGFFKTVEKATGKAVKFKAFNPSGNILSIILDMEVLQVQGLSTTILRIKMNSPKINESNPNIIVQYLVKLSVVHCKQYPPSTEICSRCTHLITIRGTEKLTGALGQDVVTYLESPKDIAKWKRFCDKHPSRDLQSES